MAEAGLARVPATVLALADVLVALVGLEQSSELVLKVSLIIY